jgi:hypothetical protein
VSTGKVSLDRCSRSRHHPQPRRFAVLTDVLRETMITDADRVRTIADDQPRRVMVEARWITFWLEAPADGARIDRSCPRGGGTTHQVAPA